MTKLQLSMLNLVSSRKYLLDSEQRADLNRLSRNKYAPLSTKDIKILNALNTFVQ